MIPRRRPDHPVHEPLADALETLAAALRAGLSPADALRVCASATEWGLQQPERMTQVARAVARGDPCGSAWHLPNDSREAEEAYRSLAAVWEVALDTGAPLAEALVTLSDQLREEARIRSRLDALAAAPRTSQRLLTLLPIVGPGLALLVGADPTHLYFSSSMGAVSAVAGVLLTVIGWRWSRAMVAAAVRPRSYAEATGAVR